MDLLDFEDDPQIEKIPHREKNPNPFYRHTKGSKRQVNPHRMIQIRPRPHTR